MTGNTRPRLLAVLSGFNPSNMMYNIKPMLALERRGLLHYRLALEAYFQRPALQGIDLVLFCRNLEPRYGHVLEAVRAHGIPYIYDLDDDLFNVPLQSDDGQYYNDPLRIAQLERYLRSAALVRVYSQPLQERVLAYNPHVRLVTPPVDDILLAHPPARSPGGPVKIVYATSRRDDYLFPLFEPALLELLRRYGDRVALYFWGFLPPAFAGLPGVHYLKFVAHYDRFLAEFQRMGFDIGLAPLMDDRFHRSKTNTKFREYGACGIAGVYSNVSIYASSVEDGRTGLLVENTTQAWLEALERLVNDAGLRQRIGQAARQTVEQHYSPAEFLQVWQQHIQVVLSGPPAAGPAAAPLADAGTPPAPPAPLSTPPAGGGGWGYRVRRSLELLRQGELGRILFNTRAHVSSLWWLFKVNRLKRL